jgi:hypothetical protein
MKTSWAICTVVEWHADYAPFLAGRTFEPEQIAVMSAAFTDACKALSLDADNALMPLVAQHVMGLGQRGVKARAVLYLLTLEEFRPYRQNQSQAPRCRLIQP